MTGDGTGRRLTCDCGFVVETKRDDELVRIARAHALEAHAVRFSVEQILALARAADGRRARDER